MSAAFDWSAVYETGFAEVDAQHRRLVDMINRMATPDGAADDALFDELLDYAARHFADEEVLMSQQRLSAAAVAAHVAQHRGFVAEVLALRQGGGGDKDAATLQRYLASWLAFHILGTDRAMASQIRLVQAGVD
ncbi:MAG: bacteriohemerythrin, partial [Leptothrix sp. (in: b-proteobacteria)]